MINEVVEVKSYLIGNNINQKNLYRIVTLLAKHFKEQGKSHIEIRNSIFEWGKQHNIFIKYKVNSIIYKVVEDTTPLQGDTVIKINKNDIEEINSRFSSKNSKLVALALLCYDKAHADKNKAFDISSVALSAWTGIAASNLSSRYFRELYDFGYLTKLESPQNTFKWDSDKKNSVYQLSVSTHNSGDYLLVDNNIHDLYSEVFS